ncbi:DR2241 family protein [Salinirubellus salinus]|uniref:DR2241 family protein n=1 Tax=Salinirubellus salinus TaxID=1364945 RepID=A0A9E7R5J6_9EURY|nr:DR2241 family protein [Salinirubellus salinus]UWM55957.1 DR2241 family protein [Salinirubellus salinus]
MDETTLAALREAAADGIEYDGLRVAETDAGYEFAVAADERTGLDADGLAAAARDHPEHVDNWYTFSRPRSEARTAFLRWVEGADDHAVPERYEALREGVARAWGQLRVSVTLEDGDRTYEVRHEADVDEPVADLDTYTDPLDARSLVKYDDRGRYRPLKTAPSLPTGWAFVDLAPNDLTATVEQIYPATVENWYLERQGDLDISHWHPTMQRQSGIYGVVKTWDRNEGYEHVNWVAEACCDDSQCLKRREWQYDEDTPLDVDGGDGEFPCREPCSLVVTAARKWTRLEGESTRTYEFDLTPSEKEQVERIVEAVADGETEQIREADVKDPANRYRARFLRAKRFDDAGNLSGTPTARDDE